MIKTKTLIIAAIALMLIVIVAGTVVLSLPFIIDRDVQPTTESTATPDPVVEFPTATPVVIVVTATPEPTATDVPTEVPTETSVPTATNTPAPTSIPVPCDWAAFVSDVTVKDGTDMVPGEDFTKTWRVKNIGTCTWTSDYDIVFSSGSSMGASSAVALPGIIRPGETVDISVAMEAPADEGTYTGYWMLRNATGKIFGIGDNQNKALWVVIDVEQPCYWAKFITDVTVPDGTNFSPGVSFTKTWRLKNIGSCDWTSSFDLVYVNGTSMGVKVADLPQRVRIGETVDVSVLLTAPETPGDYRGYWKLKADNGTVFGIGPDQDNPIWVDIDVLNVNTSYVFDFAGNYCSAVWKSSVGILPCPGKSGDDNGFVVRIEDPDLENREENEPALWTRPNKADNGWISGKFPAIEISEGDHFKAWIGCLYGSDDCNVTFYLEYQIDDGPVKNLGSWHEVYDGKATMLDIDLSDLAGENVKFIFSVEVSGGKASEADAFWFVPRIE